MAGGMPTVMLAAIAFRGMYLARQLRGSALEVIEVYPGAAFRSLGWDGKSASIDKGWSLISSLVGSVTPGSRDALDALCAGLVAAGYARGGAESLPSLDGKIWGLWARPSLSP